MKINSIVSKKNEWIVPAAIMFIKALLVLPLFENIYSVIIGNMKLTNILGNVVATVCVLAISVIYSLMLVKTGEKIGEKSVLFIVFALADPLLIVTVHDVFHALAVIVTLVWIIVSLKVENRIVVMAVSAVSAAVVSLVMPCAVLTFVVAGILVAVISDSGKAASKAITAVVSVLSAGVFAALSSGKLRTEPAFSRILYRLASTESHVLSAGRLEYGFSLTDIFRQFVSAAFACLPFVAFAVYVIVRVVKDKNNKKSDKIFTVAATVLPFAGSFVASALCYGTGGVTGFIFAPLAVIIALLLSGNKAVDGAVSDVCAFAKKHPAVAVAAIIWIASNTFSFVSPNKVFGYAAYFDV